MGTYTGTALNDTITSSTVSAGVTRVPAGSRPSAAADTINGLGGNDVLGGSGGADTINGGDGNDDIWDIAPSGDDGFALSTNAGNIIHGNAGDDFIDIVVGDTGGANPVTNTAFGDEGDDHVSLGFYLNEEAWKTGQDPSGAIVLHGGAGNDEVGVYSYSWNFNMTGTTVYLYGESGNDRLDASSTDPNFDGDFYGGNNADFLYGGPGNDTCFVLEARDQVIERAGEGYDKIIAHQTDYTLPANVEALEMSVGYAWDETFNGTGNELDNRITTSHYYADDSTNFILNGAGGNDTIYGWAWGKDTINGGTGNDSLYGSDSDEYWEGQDDADTIRGGAGNDLIYGGSGNSDTGDGDDVLYGDGGDDQIFGSFGNDRMYGGTGADELGGQAGNDTMYGGTGNDKLGGGTGNDKMYGDADADVLSGRAGLDRLTGGTGNDIFDYDAVTDSRPGSANRDVILDLIGVGAAVGDRIDLATIDANTTKTGNQAFIFKGTGAITGAGQVHVIASGGDTLIQANTGGSLAPEPEILVKDGTALPGQWVAGDFIL